MSAIRPEGLVPRYDGTVPSIRHVHGLAKDAQTIAGGGDVH